MNIRQVSAICLSIAATHFVYAASNVANPVNDSSQTKGITLYTTNFTEPLSYQGSAFLKLPKFP
ncbi:hypothetical protein [Acinetobacter baumannii]|uniref:hypothetical protein n=1 Tax=Acinetobacter baumannii TaxID=470 RepID=UPI003391B8C3